MQIGQPLLLILVLLNAFGCLAQPAPRPELSSAEARELAQMLCRQLPNVSTIIPSVRIEGQETSPPPPPQEPMVTDDVYDALLQLGPYSLRCLTDRLLDVRWMPDPRSEPLLGAPVTADVAYMILLDKGVPDVLPGLAHRTPNQLRMDDYFLWPRAGNHRQRLQNAVREWTARHPDCCGAMAKIRATAPSAAKFRMSKSDLARIQNSVSRLRLGMKPEEVLKITGKPDAVDPGNSDNPDHRHTALLGFCAGDHNETLAYIYFIERWADEIARRDPLRDRYVIVFFSGEGKLTRMFSNVAAIAPMLPPSSYRVWLHLICSKCKNG
jgi:hypothetical protein